MEQNSQTRQKSDGFIAIDIVLLPPDEVMKRAIDMNRVLSEKYDNGITLRPDKCMPHITLAMGCIRKSDIDQIASQMEEISYKFANVELEVEGGGSKKAWFKIVPEKYLQLMHESVMTGLFKFFSYNVKKEMFYSEGDESINDLTVSYVERFPMESSFEGFTPHITVGSCEIDEEIEGFHFVASKLALCHLGNFCTCRRILRSFNLVKA